MALREAIGAAEAWLKAAPPGHPTVNTVVERVVALASHSKWEVRHDVAHFAGQTLHPLFEPVLVTLAGDDNARVRRVAEQATLRRRDWASSTALGKQHEERINATLDNIEARFGLLGRQAVKRAAEQIAHTFTRTVYHEVVRLLTPVNSAAERLRASLTEHRMVREEHTADADLVSRRVAHLGRVLDAMRAYAAPSKVAFASESVRGMLNDAVEIVEHNALRKLERHPEIVINCAEDVAIDAARSLLVQAFTNLLENAVEAYEGCDPTNGIVVTVAQGDGRVTVAVEDSGSGMSERAVVDAPLLFATTKPNGTGFGLPWAIKIIESDHAGRLRLESKKGKGTTVVITLPLRQLVEHSP